MSGIRKSLIFCRCEFMKWRKNYKLLLILILLFILLLYCTDRYFSYARQVQYPSSPWLYPFLMNNIWGRCTVLFCGVLYFSNVFTADPVNKYQLFRCGHRAFLWGKIFYIAGAALIYLLLVQLLLLLPHLDQICLEGGWGKLIGSWTYNEKTLGAGGLLGSRKIIENYSALSGMSASLFLSYLNLLLLGEVIYLMNVTAGRGWGILCGGMLVAVDLGVQLMSIYDVQALAMHFSPISWSQISMLSLGEASYYQYPTLMYGVVMSLAVVAAAIIILVLLRRISYRSGSKRQWMHLTGD